MAATALGYLTWGIKNDPAKYGLGDLGGWPLDLLQIWGLIVVTASMPIWHHGFINTLGRMKDLGTMTFLRMQMRG